MTDFEITLLCAKAMGGWFVNDGKVHIPGDFDGAGKRIVFDPLHDDAQAMALVKKFRTPISPGIHGWHCGLITNMTETTVTTAHNVIHADLNRAICLAVARMQSAAPQQK